MRRQQATKEWIFLTGAYALSSMSMTTLPIWLEAAGSRLHMDVAWNGALGATELASTAISAIICAALREARRERGWLACALALAMVGNLASALAPSLLLFALTRAVVGASYGFVMVSATRHAARSADPIKIFADQLLVLVGLAVIFFLCMPFVIDRAGPASPFIFFATIALILIPFCRSLRTPSHLQVPSAPSQSEPGRTPRAVLTLYAGFALTFAVQAGAWAYLAPAGAQAAFGPTGVSLLLSVGAVINLAAPPLAKYVTAHTRLATAAGLGFTGFAASALMSLGAIGPVAFLVGTTGIPFFLLYLGPILSTALAHVDADGRAAGGAPAASMIGAAAGPAVANLCYLHGGTREIAIAAGLAAGVGWLACKLGLRDAYKAGPAGAP